MGNADKKPLISVIVPVYNVENYLRACVDSIIAQTYNNLEIILVDDGSPDNCPAICDEYAEKDSRIKVIHKENGGLSDARNAGLSVMTGEYLMFVDSDDLLPKNAVSALYNLAVEYNSELVIGNHRKFVDSTDLDDSDLKSNKASCLSKTESICHMFQNGCASWGRLYRADIHNSVHFPIGEINEDEAIVLKILDKCNKVVITDECVYHYRTRPESITTSSFSLKKLDWYRHCKANLEWIREHYPELEEYAAVRYRSSIMYSLNELALFDPLQENYVIELMTDLKLNRELFKRLSSSRSEKLRAFLLTSFPFGVYRSIVRRRHKK
jgi:glycosyltransferase involved in cell wall biosynthesis